MDARMSGLFDVASIAVRVAVDGGDVDRYQMYCNVWKLGFHNTRRFWHCPILTEIMAFARAKYFLRGCEKHGNYVYQTSTV